MSLASTRRLALLGCAACLLQGCLKREAVGAGVVFAHTWSSCFLVFLALAACAALGTAAFAARGPLSRRVAALSFMGAVMIAVAVLPPWLYDRIELDPAGIKLRRLHNLKATRYEMRWDRLDCVRAGWSSPSEPSLGFVEKGKLMEPVSIRFDKETVDAILPDLARLSQAAGARFDSSL